MATRRRRGRAGGTWSTADLHLVDHGGTGPELLLVHGLGGNHAHWHALVPHLVTDHRVRSLDLPGFGRSRPTPGGTVEELAAAVTALCGQLGAPQVLVGNSMGGLVTLLAARARPEVVAGAVLVDPAVPRSRTTTYDPEVAAVLGAYATPFGHRALRERWARLGPEGLVAETLRLCCVDATRVDPAAVAAITREVATTMARPEAALGYLRAVRSIARATLRHRPYWDLVAGVDVPALVVQGERDRLVLLDAVEELARRRPDWPLVVLRGIGHVPQLEDPAATARAVRRLTGGLPRARPPTTAGAA